LKNDKWGGSSSSSDLTEESTDISVRFSRGLEHLREADVDNAKKVFDDIISEDSDYAPAFFGLSCVHIRLDAKELALQFIKRALELDPGYGEAHLVMARLLYDDGDLVGGYDHVKKAVQLGVSPNSGNELINSLIQSRPSRDDEKRDSENLDSDPSTVVSEKPVSELIDESILEETEAVTSVMSAQSYRETEPVNQSFKNILISLSNFRSVLEGGIQNRWVLSVFFLALLARVYVLWMMPIDWNWDSYHHWQIAYYTLHIGFRQFRMWDLRGMEYFWGIVPSLIEAILLWLFRTSSMIPFRIVNMILGSASSVLVYKIGEDKFNRRVGLFSGVLVALASPFTVFDITGLGDTLATFLVLASIYLTDKNPSLSGVLLALGCQSRIEFWGIAALYFFFSIIYRRYKHSERRIDYFFPKLIAWLLMMVVFFIFFWVQTGNPFYPFYWSVYNTIGGYSGSSAGSAFSDLLIGKILSLFSPSSEFFTLRMFFMATFFISMYFYINSIRKQPENKNIDFFIMLLAIIVFRSVHIVGGGAKWLTDSFVMLLMIRVYQLDIALGFLSIFYFSSKIVRNKYQLSTIIFIILLPISILNTGEYSRFQDSQKVSFEISDNFIQYYDGGTITCDNPNMVYQLIHRGGIRPKNILSNHYSAFYYTSNPTIEQYLAWFVGNNITFIFLTGGGWSHQIYSYAQSNIPDLFITVGVYKSIEFLKVNQTVVSATLS